MKDQIRTKEWECFIGTEDVNEQHDIATIICRPLGNPKNVPYIKFVKDKVFVHKPEGFTVIPNQEQYNRMAFKLKEA